MRNLNLLPPPLDLKHVIKYCVENFRRIEDYILRDFVRVYNDDTPQSGTVEIDFRGSRSHVLSIDGNTTWDFTWPTDQGSNEQLDFYLTFEVDGTYTHTFTGIRWADNDTQPAFDLVDGTEHTWTIHMVRMYQHGTWRVLAMSVIDYL